MCWMTGFYQKHELRIWKKMFMKIFRQMLFPISLSSVFCDTKTQQKSNKKDEPVTAVDFPNPEMLGCRDHEVDGFC